MIIYAEIVTERLVFTLDFVFQQRGIVYQLTNDVVTFQHGVSPKLNYSNQKLTADLQISPAHLLFSEDIQTEGIERSTWFTVDCLSFRKISDPLASIFYILSRMEEYFPKKLDKHERFSAKESILYQENWLQQCICDRWVEAIFLQLVLPKPKSTNPITIPTFDIDNARAFEWKEGWRSLLAQWRDQLRRDQVRIDMRKKVKLGKSKDPYDTFDWIIAIAQAFPETKVFWLLGDYSKYDKNISHSDERQYQLIRSIQQVAEVGIHPSYKSNESAYYVQQEVNRLSTILKEPVLSSRQHFLKVTFPETYNRLIESKIQHDFTMGFAEEPGFRMGTARTVSFFDLIKNRRTDLQLHPFCYMDGTLLEYKNYSIQESKELILKLYKEIVDYGGDFQFLWHNETIGDFGKWKGWSEVLQFSLSLKHNLK